MLSNPESTPCRDRDVPCWVASTARLSDLALEEKEICLFGFEFFYMSHHFNCIKPKIINATTPPMQSAGQTPAICGAGEVPGGTLRFWVPSAKS